MARAGSLLASEWAVAIDPARRDGRIVAEAAEEEQRSRPAPLPHGVNVGLAEALGRVGIDSLYTHQLRAYETAAESNLVITSGTASGKSLAFNLPVLDGIAARPKDRALYLYPTKALAQDQARKLAQLRPPNLREAIYDGDTPREERPAIRRRSNLVLTNPDMLHVALLPNHKGWGDFLANLELGRRRRGPHLPRRLRLPRRQRAAAAAAAGPRLRLASRASSSPRRRSPTRSSWPSGWSGPSSSWSTTTVPRVPGGRSRCGTHR